MSAARACATTAAGSPRKSAALIAIGNIGASRCLPSAILTLKCLVIGLAPGAHGANRTGRMFTGDRSGEFLYRALYQTGFASQAESLSREDGMTLSGVYITASVRCAPPDNKPSVEEFRNCRAFSRTRARHLEERAGGGGVGPPGLRHLSRRPARSRRYRNTVGVRVRPRSRAQDGTGLSAADQLLSSKPAEHLHG